VRTTDRRGSPEKERGMAEMSEKFRALGVEVCAEEE